MAKKKTLPIIIISVLVLAVIGGGFWFFLSTGGKGTVDKTEETSDDGIVSLGATFYNLQGDQPTGGVAQALIGGTNQRTHVSFELKASNTGDVELTNVEPLNPNANINGAFDNINPLASLGVGQSQVSLGTTAQSCTTNAQCDENEECVNPGTGLICLINLDQYASANSGQQNNVDFTISLQAEFLNALGTSDTVSSNPVTLTYDVRGEACSDGTSINSCVADRTGDDADNPNYCEFVEGSAPQIVENSDVCGCPVGQEPDGNGGCQALTCADGTSIEEFSDATGTFGGFNLQNGFATGGSQYNNTRVYCTTSQTLEMRCNQAKTELGGGTFTNDEACLEDALGRDAIACSPVTGNPSTCVYAGVNPGLSGGISEG